MSRPAIARLTGLAALALACSLGGCATANGPPISEIANRIAPVASNATRIWFYRDTTPVALALHPVILLDGQPIGEALPAGAFYRDVQPGMHTIATGNSPGQVVRIAGAPGGTEYVKISPEIGFFNGHIVPTQVAPGQALSDMWADKYTGPG